MAGVTLDARVSQDQNSASGTVASPKFSTVSGNELLLAFISTDDVSSPNITVKSVTGAGLTWSLVVRTNTQSGTSEIWRSFAPSVLTSASISVQLSQSVVSSLTVMTFSGVNTSGTNGSGAIGAVGSGNANPGAPAASLVTTQNNSVVVGVGNDYDNAIARTPASGQAIVHQSLASSGDTYWVQWQNSPVAAKGSKFTLSDTAPSGDRYNLSLCEVVPAAAAATLQVQTSAANLNFGSVADGSTVTQSWTISSVGTGPVTLTSASISGTGFALGATSFPVTLASGHSLTLQVEFDPKSAGAVSGKVSVNSNATNENPAVATLTGTGTTAAAAPQITLSSSSLSFGDVTDGSSATQSVTLTSTGNSPVTISSESETGSTFSLASDNFPITLNPGQTTTLSAVFKPVSPGAFGGEIGIVSNSAKGSTQQLSLSGTGVAAPHTVTLSWSPPTSSPVPVAGYNIFRAPSGGSFTQVNSSLDEGTSYVDSNVTGGDTYDYEVRSVATSGSESTASAEIAVAIPSP
jgi:hypothetical protein